MLYILNLFNSVRTKTGQAKPQEMASENVKHNGKR